MRLSLRVCLTGCLLSLLFGCTEGGAVSRKASNVWAASDGIRVSPETGKYVEDRTDIHSDYPTGDYRQRNGVWDASKNLVTLHAARNEFVSFQVIVEATEPVEGVKVALDGLTGPRGVKIAGNNVALLKAWYVIVRTPSSGYETTSLGPGWYPDALLPADEDGSVTINIPEPTNYLGQTQRNHAVFVDIFVPADREEAPPGEYRGMVCVSDRNGTALRAARTPGWSFQSHA